MLMRWDVQKHIIMHLFCAVKISNGRMRETGGSAFVCVIYEGECVCIVCWSTLSSSLGMRAGEAKEEAQLLASCAHFCRIVVHCFSYNLS